MRRRTSSRWIALSVIAALSPATLAVMQPKPDQGEEPPPAEADESAAGVDATGSMQDAGDQAGATAGTGQPTPQDIIRQFQQERPEQVPLLPSGEDDERIIRGELDEPPVDQGRHSPLMPDGTMLVDRAGRIVEEGPWWTFVFESDNTEFPEPPMKLLPNQALERMLRESRGGTDPVVFIVTGEITDFRGENYILPRKVLRKRDLGNLKK